MSDSVKGTEVEDVLLSVRRLISNDLRSKTPLAEVVEQKKKAAEADDKLVLTEALRVENDATPAEASAEQSEPPAESDPASDLLDQPFEEPVGFGDSSLEDRIAELEAAISERPDEWEPDGSEDQTQHQPTEMVMSRRPSAGKRPLRLTRLSLVDQIGIELPEPANVQPADGASQPEVLDPDPTVEEGAETLPQGVTPETVQPGVGDVEEQPSPQAQMADEVDEIEAATVPVETRVEETPVEDPSVPSSVEEADVMEDDDVPYENPIAGRSPQAVSRMRELYQDEVEAKVMDDEALRTLVSALIREELQGELGERITRNVRKLVRREIQRALAARDLH